MTVAKGLQCNLQLHLGLAVDGDKLVVMELDDVALLRRDDLCHPHQLAGLIRQKHREGENSAPADQAMLDQPGWFLSYGAETVDETDVAFTYWEKDGIRYLLMDDDAAESAESLFSMAEELVRSGK